MKHRSLLFSVLIIAAVAVGCAGCGTFTPDKAKADIKAVAKIGASKAISIDPNARAYVESVEVVVETALNDGTFDPAALKDALSKVSVKELHDPVIQESIADVFTIYEAQFGDVVSKGLDKNVYVRPILEGLRDGLKAALNSP